MMDVIKLRDEYVYDYLKAISTKKKDEILSAFIDIFHSLNADVVLKYFKDKQEERDKPYLLRRQEIINALKCQEEWKLEAMGYYFDLHDYDDMYVRKFKLTPTYELLTDALGLMIALSTIGDYQGAKEILLLLLQLKFHVDCYDYVDSDLIYDVNLNLEEVLDDMNDHSVYYQFYKAIAKICLYGDDVDLGLKLFVDEEGRYSSFLYHMPIKARHEFCTKMLEKYKAEKKVTSDSVTERLENIVNDDKGRSLEALVQDASMLNTFELHRQMM